jgi:hypothetical protein
MATAGKSGAGDKVTAPESTHLAVQPSRWKRNLAVLVALALGGALAFAWQGLREEALVGAAYGARVGCVCRFVSQRPIAACEADLKVAGLSGVAGMVSLSEDAASQTVTGSVPLLASQSADYREARGCQLEPWQD